MAPPTGPPPTGPPPFLVLAAHPVRWQLLRELAESDRQVSELTDRTGERQSLVSYHLGRLRAEGLVSARRSVADGREWFYVLDLVRCGEVLAASGAALHPGLRLVRADVADATPAGRARAPASRRPRVLFLCTGNSARSLIAEALARELSAGAVEAVSAGSHPKPLHPNTVRVLAERGIDLGERTPTHVNRYARRRFDHVVSLCDRVREVCPSFAGEPYVTHWSLPDPAAEGTTDGDTYPAFARTADELEVRIRFLLDRLFQPHEEVA